MSVNISVMQAVSLYIEGQHSIKVGKDLLRRFKSESARNEASIELHKKGTQLVTEGTNFVNLARMAFNKRLITRLFFNILLA